MQELGLTSAMEVRQLNKFGKAAIIAPNHLSPAKAWRRSLVLADDYPVLKKALRRNRINDRVVFRVDGDIEIGDSAVKGLLYDLHRKIFSAIGRVLTGGIPLAINASEPKIAQSRNVKGVLEIMNTLKSGVNITLYPYGNWFEPDEQAFTEIIGHDGFVPMGDFEAWRKSLKSGPFRLSQMTEAPIWPVYVDRAEDENWAIRFGNLLYPEDYSRPEIQADAYLMAMRQLRSQQRLAVRNALLNPHNLA